MYDYTKQIRLTRLKVGILVSAGLLVLIVSLMFAGSLENLFTEKIKIYAIFDNIQGLRAGAPVRFSGMEIGSVKELDFEPGSRIRAALEIQADTLKYLKTDSRAQILTLGLLGDKYVGISPGSRAAPHLEPGANIKGELELGFQDVVQSSEQVMARIDDFLKEIGKITKDLEFEGGSLVKLLSDPRLYENLEAATGNFAALLHKINEGQGTLGLLLNDPSLYNELVSSARGLDAFASRLAGAQGSLQKFIEDPSVYENLRASMQTLAQILEDLESGQGTLGRLVRKEDLYADLARIASSLKTSAARIESGKGLLGEAVANDQLGDEFAVAVKELRKLVQEIRRNPKKYFDLSLF